MLIRARQSSESETSFPDSVLYDLLLLLLFKKHIYNASCMPGTVLSTLRIPTPQGIFLGHTNSVCGA